MNNKDVSNDNLKAFKEFVNKIVDLKQLVFRLWISLWIVLFILLIMKYCFGVWYPIVVDNEIFIKICDFINENKIVSLIITGIFYLLSANLICLTSMGKKTYHNKIETILFETIILGTYIIKIFSNNIGMIIEVLYCVLLTILINLKQKKFKKKILNILTPIFTYIIVNSWQFTIYFVRDLDIQQLDKYPSLIFIILMLDYYVFLIISWIGVSFMGLLSIGWLFGKTITDLEAMKKEEIAKSKPDLKLIADIDEAIRKKKEKENKKK